jgi:F5/8 type C domain
LVTRQLTLKASDRKPPELGPRVRVEAVHLNPPGDEKGLSVLINGAGLSDRDKDGLLEQDTAATNMWRGDCAANLSLEFELAEPVALGTIEVWNYNGEWQTTEGVRKADVAVSSDGTTWQTVLRGAEFAEAEGTSDYDEPIRLKLQGATVRKVRFENIVPWNDKGKVGLSKVVFHQAMGAQAALRTP